MGGAVADWPVGVGAALRACLASIPTELTGRETDARTKAALAELAGAHACVWRHLELGTAAENTHATGESTRKREREPRKQREPRGPRDPSQRKFPRR